MPTADARYDSSRMKTLLVAVDFSDVANAVVAAASALAQRLAARVVLIHVAAPEPSFVTYEPGPQHERDHRAKVLRKEHRDLQVMADELGKQGVVAEALLVQGATVDKLIDEADRLAVDMIVIGSHGHGALYHLLVGSVAEGVLRRTKRPVLVVPGRK